MIPMSDQRALGPSWAASVAIPGRFKVSIHTVAVCITFVSARIIEMIEAKNAVMLLLESGRLYGFARKFSCSNYLKMGQAPAEPNMMASAELPSIGSMEEGQQRKTVLGKAAHCGRLLGGTECLATLPAGAE